jgi:glycogen operon protein
LERSEIDVIALKKQYLQMTYNHPRPHITWHGIYFGQPDWSYDSHSLAFTLHHPDAEEQLHVILNAYWRPLLFELPPLGKGKHWHRIIDTSLHSPQDFCEIDVAPIVKTDRYPSQSRSSLVFIAK